MARFEIIQPSARLSAFVEQYWSLDIDNAKPCSQRYIPSCYTTLTFHRGEPIYSTLHSELQPKSSLCGQCVTHTDIIYSGNLDYIMVAFYPVAAKIFFGIPMHETRNRNIETELLGDTSLRDLANRLMDTKDNRRCADLIESYLLDKLHSSTADIDKLNRMNAVVGSINSGYQNITELSNMACLGYKQFKRTFAEYAGLNPKEFIQIVRFRKVLHSLHSGVQTNLNELAYECGYSDKSHLLKDFRTFTGYTPKEYLSTCDPYSEYLSLFNSIFINGCY